MALQSVHDTIFSQKSWHHGQSQVMTTCSTTNHGTLLNHKSRNHVQYMYDVLELLPNLYPWNSLGLPSDVLYNMNTNTKHWRMWHGKNVGTVHLS